MRRKLTVGSCFSGIGGLELGLEWTGGFETKWQIEIDPYASAVLKKHWPNVKRYSDITTVDGGILEPVDVICGGFPCQDVSFAGKRKGLEGKRTTLWSELFRLVREIRPQWLVAENVPGLLSSDDGRFFGNILRDLASIGFDAGWGVLSAAGMGAPHLRKRVFILAHAVRSSGSPKFGIEQGERTEIIDSSRTGNVADTDGKRHKSGLSLGMEVPHTSPRNSRKDATINTASKRLSDGTAIEIRQSEQDEESQRSDWWSTEPDVGRVAHGVPSRVDRLKCLGNAVVPQVAERVGRMILEYERNPAV